MCSKSHGNVGKDSWFSGFELRVCFSWGSGFREISSWANWSNQTEPQLSKLPAWRAARTLSLESVFRGVWIHLLGVELKLKRSWCWVGAPAAYLLSLVSIWCLLFAQGECWPEIETQA